MSFLPVDPATGAESAGRYERTERILTVAADLLVQWGYKRVTIEDIATHAGVGTGTVYLHWKTKEKLFETVLLRELVAIWAELIERIRADPAEALLHRFLRALLMHIKQRPVARAVFTRDGTMLGKLTQSSMGGLQDMAISREWIATLRQLGLMRTDIDMDTQAYMFSAIWTGFGIVDQFLPPSGTVVIEQQAEALVQAIRRTLEPDVLPTDEMLRSTIAPTMLQFLEQARAYYLDQIDHHTIGRGKQRAASP